MIKILLIKLTAVCAISAVGASSVFCATMPADGMMSEWGKLSSTAIGLSFGAGCVWLMYQFSVKLGLKILDVAMRIEQHLEGLNSKIKILNDKVDGCPVRKGANVAMVP